MKTYPETITRPYWEIMQSEVFRLDGPAIDLPEVLAELGNAIADADTSGDEYDYIWDVLGEHTEAPLGDLIVGAYWSLTEWHAGQHSPEYAAMCALGRVFSPGCTCAPEVDDGSGESTAYELVGKWFEGRAAK